jgi:hypothetical protein
MEHTHDQSGERLLLVYLLFSVKTQVNNIDSPKSPFWSGSMLHKSCFTLTDTHGTVSSVISPNGNQKRDEMTQITYFNSKTRPSTKHKSTILPTTVPLAWIDVHARFLVISAYMTYFVSSLHLYAQMTSLTVRNLTSHKISIQNWDQLRYIELLWYIYLEMWSSQT